MSGANKGGDIDRKKKERGEVEGGWTKTNDAKILIMRNKRVHG